MKIKNSQKILLIFVILITIIFLQSNFTLAADNFGIKIDPISTEIYPDEYADYNLTITNNFNYKETFVLTSNSKWFIKQSDFLKSIPVNESKTVVVSLKPRTIMKLGKGYDVPLNVEAIIANQKTNSYASLFLMSYEYDFGEYIPSMNIYAEFNERADPRERFKITLRLRNRNPLNISKMNLIVHSDDVFHKEIIESLKPLQEKTIQVSFDIDKDLIPAEHRLDVWVDINNKTYASLRDNFEIISFADIEVVEEKDREFLRTITKLNAVNNGNSAGTKTVAIQKNWLERIFTTTNIGYEVTSSDGKAVISWTLELEPDDKVEIIVSNNYRLLFAIIIIILLAIYLYFNMRSEVIVQKRASVMHKTYKKEEGSSLLKIKLFIKNRTSKKLHDVEVKERLSKLTQFIDEPDSIGSPNPSKIIHGKNSTLVKWHFESLEPYEERLITYKLESRFKLVGSIQFPRAIVKFRTHEGKVHTTGSNKATLNFVVNKK